ncbi:hypothetical protein AT2G18685 [Arabidopsis thaliana]|jgi:hypothetical protein|uniref:Uncharacterized protein n=2 Tax=Arabidopsis thaliana TaxID=3702 RepID=A0A1P8B0V4_ARATH|nr:uncharacterized protein AT2G18685 [Arabidopsis thaliana]ANM62543.1 hypothetical protein AT2G18685 [Arabidopsis thaliana]CAA0365440.1 unnamed protein product [Arabidopsis thaliana]|eukprot:NP_001324692.1 hypothetical protein AT2G18685 [Arabidopsis thaliana]
MTRVDKRLMMEETAMKMYKELTNWRKSTKTLIRWAANSGVFGSVIGNKLDSRIKFVISGLMAMALNK